jgi:hypothetical protein
MKTKDTELLRRVGRIVAGAYYDHQQVRIGAMNRLRDIIWRKNEGIPFDKVIDKKEEKSFGSEYGDTKILALLQKMTDEKKLNPDEMEYLVKMVRTANKEGETEILYKQLMSEYISQEEVYTTFLRRIKGISMVLSANMLKWFGYCERYATVSAMWKHCGMHVVDADGTAVAPKRKRGEKVDWNPQLRTLCWKIADSFVKQRTPYYRKLYDGRKAYELGREDGNKPKSKLHADLRARRFMVKRFLQHYWDCSRELAGMERSKPWVIEHGGHAHYETWRDAAKANEEARMP